MDVTVLENAGNAIKNFASAYGDADLIYKKTAIIASQKLSKNVSEYEIAMIQASFIDALLTMTKADPKLYSEMIRLMVLASGFSSGNADNYRAMNLSTVESALDESTKAIAKALAPQLPKVNPEN